MTTTTTRPLDIAALAPRHRGTRRRGDHRACTPTDATLTMLDRDHPPAARRCSPAASEIGAYYRDICGRNIDHQVAGRGQRPRRARLTRSTAATPTARG